MASLHSRKLNAENISIDKNENVGLYKMH